MSVLPDKPDKYVPTTLPGSRAPYVTLIKEGKRISILDLFENEYVLLVGSAGQVWQEAVNQLALPIKCYRIAPDGDLFDPENNWHQLYEVTPQSAVLVRPDGHVAWRSKEGVDDPKNVLRNILVI